MIVECGHCGAPLDVREGREYTRCTYCKKTSERRRLRTIEAQTPPGWRPPAVWRPPPHVPANSDVTLKYAAAATVSWVIFVFIMLAVVGGIAAYAAVGASRKRVNPFSPSAAARLSPEVLAKITLKETPEKLQKLSGVAMDAHQSMRIPINHPHWEAVTFRWDPDHLDHVKDFYLNANDSPSVEPRKTLKSLLGSRWEKDGFQWEGCGLNMSDKGDHLSAHVTIDQHGKETAENPRWRLQTETMWKLARFAALGVGDAPTKAELRDHLGRGYALGEVLKLDLEADIDQADAATKKVYPGAVRNLFIDLNYVVAIDHPWYSQIEISWNNKKGAKVKELELRPPVGTSNKWPSQKAVDDCMLAAFGKPERVYEGQHLGGSRDTTWKPAAGGSIRVYQHMVVVTLRDSPFAKPMPREVWQKAVTAFDQCGRTAQ